MHRKVCLQQPETTGYFTPNLERHVGVPDFAVLKEIYLHSIINPYFLLFDFWPNNFYSATIDASMTLGPIFHHGTQATSLINISMVKGKRAGVTSKH